MSLPRNILLVVIGVLLLLSISFVLPFLDFFLLAVLLAYLLLPVQKRVEHRIRSDIATAAVVTAASIVVILPLVFVVWTTITEAATIVEAIREGEVTLSETEAQIQQLTGMQVDIANVLQSAASGIQVDNLLSVFGVVTHVLIGIGLTIFLLYFFLKDRQEFLAWLYETVPLPDDVQGRLYDRFNKIMGAVILGHVLVALVQGILAGIGLAATGVPNATFWTVVMSVLSLLPVVGSFLVWGPAAIYLFLNGQTFLAAGLVLWGAVVVGVSDDYLRPIVVDRYAEINPSVIIIGVLGGLYVLGVMGLFFGPIVLGMLRAALDVFREEFGTGEELQSADHTDG